MEDRDWPATSEAIAQTERTNSLDPYDEVPTQGNRMLRALAEASAGRLVEIADGVWIESRIGDEPPIRPQQDAQSDT